MGHPADDVSIFQIGKNTVQFSREIVGPFAISSMSMERYVVWISWLQQVHSKVCIIMICMVDPARYSVRNRIGGISGYDFLLLLMGRQ